MFTAIGDYCHITGSDLTVQVSHPYPGLTCRRARFTDQWTREAPSNAIVVAKMKKSYLAGFVRILSAMLLIALQFTSLVQFLAEGGKTPATIQHSSYPMYFAAYGVCALIIALDLKSVKRFLEKPLVRWAFAALTLFTWGMLVRTFNAPAGIEDYLFFRTFGLRVNAIGFLLCCTMIFDDPDALRTTKRAVVVATLAGAALNFYDFMFPGTFSDIPGRAAGLYRQANTSGMALVFGCLIGLSAIRRGWWREAFVLTSSIGVLLTFSRESILAFGCIVLAGILASRLSLRRLAVSGCVGVTLFILFNMGNNFMGNNFLTGNNLLGEKIATSENWSRLTSDDESARERAHLAKRTLDAFEDAPLLGQGFGTTRYCRSQILGLLRLCGRLSVVELI